MRPSLGLQREPFLFGDASEILLGHNLHLVLGAHVDHLEVIDALHLPLFDVVGRFGVLKALQHCDIALVDASLLILKGTRFQQTLDLWERLQNA